MTVTYDLSDVVALLTEIRDLLKQSLDERAAVDRAAEQLNRAASALEAASQCQEKENA